MGGGLRTPYTAGVRLKNLGLLVRDSYLAFSQDNAPRLAAALAYYAISSIAPLLFLFVSVGSLFVSQDEVKAQIYGTVQQSLGAATANFLIGLIQNVASPRAGTLATIIGAVTLFLTTTAFFVQIQSALNSLWGSNPPPPQSIWRIILTRIISFVMVLVFGALIIVFLVGNTYLSAIAERLGDVIGFGAFFVRIGTFLFSALLFTPVFAAVFKFLPDIKLQWREVWVGAGVTAALFTLGQVAIGVYLGRTAPGSVYGAASSLFILLLWLYYSALIFFFGAEVTWTYSQHQGSRAGGAQNPDKKAAVAAQGGAVDPTPSHQERRAGASAPPPPPEPAPPPASALPSRRPGLVGVLLSALLGLLAVPAVLVLEVFGLAGTIRRRRRQ